MKNFINHLLTSGLILLSLGIFVLIFVGPYWKIAFYILISAIMLWNISMIYGLVYDKIQKLRSVKQPES